ncbi:MAG: bifunctional RNase H/acid phosphatase [Longispora sp.]|nr:bifunctional RNase H/acid phosphatase [Longispora sp. (in: high G+C Gram-positive bacteria)]
MRVFVEADGGSRGNPGPAGYGAVVLDPETGAVIAERARSLGIATNNVAEYSGLIAGLQAAQEVGARVVDVRMDSKLVVEQMSGRWQIKNEGLRPLARQAAALAREFDRVSFTWIPRARNTKADALANRAMDGETISMVANVPAPAVAPESSLESSPERSSEPSPTLGTWAPRSEAPTRLILLRHGETELTASGRYSGRGDVHLSPVGAEQAAMAAERIMALAPGVAAVVTSPLWRARQSAQAVADRYGCDVIVDPDLIECDFGVWEGLTFVEVAEKWPAELAAWVGSTALAPPCGESFDAVAARVRDVVGRTRREYEGKTVVVVSHVTPIKVILREALEAGPGFLQRLHLDPAGVSVVDSWPDGGTSVRLVNDTSHVREYDR